MISLSLVLLFNFLWSIPSRAQIGNLRTIYQFPDGTWVENIAIRPNGNMLVTLVNTPELWEIDPFASRPDEIAQLVHHFDDATMLNGITELGEDTFALIASNTIWTLDFNIEPEVNISRIVAVPAGVLNGMATLDARAGTVLVSDSRLGLVWYVDMKKGTYEVVLQDATMTALPGRRSLIGINGIKVLGDTVYYNNCPGRLFCRVQIDRDTGHAVDSYDTIAEGALADDFAITYDGTAFLAGLDDNIVTRIWPNGTVETIAGNLNSSALAGATAAAFGRTTGDANVLYVTTGGGEAAPVNGTYIEGGKIVALTF